MTFNAVGSVSKLWIWDSRNPNNWQQSIDGGLKGAGRLEGYLNINDDPTLISWRINRYTLYANAFIGDCRWALGKSQNFNLHKIDPPIGVAGKYVTSPQDTGLYTFDVGGKPSGKECGNLL